MQVPVKTLLKPGPEYDAKVLELYDAMYAGGSKFEDVKPSLLVKREIERSGGEAGARSYKMRLERAAYLNRLGGIIDFFCAKVFVNNPRVVPQATGPDAEYWESLNDDADGNGTPFATLCRQTLREMLISNRAYIKVNFDDEEDELQASISLKKAMEVDDWMFGKDGELEWVRCHAVDVERPMIATDEDKAQERHTWTFYTRTSVDIYEARKPVGTEWENEAVAIKIDEEGEHDMEVVPFFDTKSDEGLWLVERLFDGIKALYNRESATQFALDQQCFAVPVLTTDDTAGLPSVQMSQLLALCLKTGEKFEFVAPNVQVFGALSDDIERLRQALYEVLQSVAMNAASIPQAGRLSGEAVDAFQSPMNTLVDAFAWPVKNAMKRMVEFLREYRGDEFEVELEGFEQALNEETEEENEDAIKKVIGADGEPVDENEPEPYDSKKGGPDSPINKDSKLPKWRQ